MCRAEAGAIPADGTLQTARLDHPHPLLGMLVGAVWSRLVMVEASPECTVQRGGRAGSVLPCAYPAVPLHVRQSETGNCHSCKSKQRDRHTSITGYGIFNLPTPQALDLPLILHYGPILELDCLAQVVSELNGRLCASWVSGGETANCCFRCCRRSTGG